VATIGVAVPVPDPWGAQLQEYRVLLGDEAAAGIPTHITLSPPLDVEESGLAVVERHLAACAEGLAPFEVQLRGSGTFRPVSPVVFVNVVRGISQCERLAMCVRRGPLAVEAEFPYHPHVTVAHHLGDDLLDKAFDEMADFDTSFVVDAFRLYVHLDGSGWKTARDYPLDLMGEE
jgi:2'-5' RNA ligase